MSFKDALAKALGVTPKEGQTEIDDDELAKKFSEALDTARTAPVPPNVNPNDPPPVQLNGLSQEQVEKVLNDLRKNNDEASRRQMANFIEEVNRNNAQLQASLRLSEAHSRIKTLGEGRGYTLTIPQQENLLQILVKAPKELSDEIFKLFYGIKETGMVELRELGSTQQDVTLADMDDPVKSLTEGVNRKMSANPKLSYSDALREFSREKPDVYAAYRRAVDLNQGVNA